MLRFVDIDEAVTEVDANAHDDDALTVEAQEAYHQQQYEEALALQLTGNGTAAAAAYEQLLAQDLILHAEGLVPCHSQAERPSLQLKFLALRNLAELHEAAGALQDAINCLLAAVQLQERDATLWQRLGSLALRLRQPHLGRMALEQAVTCSPHNQLAALRLRQLLVSLGDAQGVAALHGVAVHSLPHLASHLPPPPATRQAAINYDRHKWIGSDCDNAHDNEHDAERQRANFHALQVPLASASWAAVATALVSTWRLLTSFSKDEPTAGGAHASELTDSPSLCLGRRIKFVVPQVAIATSAEAELVPTAAAAVPEAHNEIMGMSDVHEAERAAVGAQGVMGCNCADREMMASSSISSEQATQGANGKAPVHEEVPAHVTSDDADDAGTTRSEMLHPTVGGIAIDLDTELEALGFAVAAAAVACALRAAASGVHEARTVPEPSRRQPSRTSRKRGSASNATEFRLSPTKYARDSAQPPTPGRKLRQLLNQFAKATVPAATAAMAEVCHVAATAVHTSERSPEPHATLTDEAAIQVEETMVHDWLATTAVSENSGVLHVASLLMEHLLSTFGQAPSARGDLEAMDDKEIGISVARGDPGGKSITAPAQSALHELPLSLSAGLGQGELLRSMSVARRAELAWALLQVHETFSSSDHGAMLAYAPLPVAHTGRSGCAVTGCSEAAISLVELQLDAAWKGAIVGSGMGIGGGGGDGEQKDDGSSQGINRRSHASLATLSERMHVLQCTLRWRRHADVPWAHARELHLLVRLCWAQARCEELRGCAAKSLEWLQSCKELLMHCALETTPVRPFSLLAAPAAISHCLVADAERRQEEQRLMQAARAALKTMSVHSGLCTASEWISEVRVGDERATDDALHRCNVAWPAVVASATSTSSAWLQAVVQSPALTKSLPCGSPSVASMANENGPNHEESALNISLKLLHVCWIGLCEQHAMSSSTAGPYESNGPCSLSAGLTDLLVVYDNVLYAALRVATTAAAKDRQDAASVQGVVGGNLAGAGPSSVESAAEGHAAATACTEATIELWVLRLTHSVDAFRRSRQRCPPTLHKPQMEAHEEMDSMDIDFLETDPRGLQLGAPCGSSRQGDTMVVETADQAAWASNADKLLPRLAALAEHVSSALPTNRRLLHHALTCFSKLWMLYPDRTSAESLLLLEGTWKAAMSLGATPLQLPMSADARADGRVEGRVDGRPGPSRGGRAAQARRQLWESPFAQLCMVTALRHLETLDAEQLNAPLLIRLESDVMSGGSNADANAEEDEDGTGSGAGCPANSADGYRGAAGLSAEELQKRRDVMRALEWAFRRARHDEKVGDTPVPGAEGWIVRWKARLRKAAGGVSGDAYMLAPSGETLDSLRKLEMFLGLAEEPTTNRGGAALPLSVTKPHRLAAQQDARGDPTANLDAKDDGLQFAGMPPPETVRDGWESLLHASCQHLHGTRADALSPGARVALKPQELESERAKRDERRCALLSNHSIDRRYLLQYLRRLSPPLPLLAGLSGPLDTSRGVWEAFGASALSSALTRKLSEARHRELQVHLRRLMPAEACPALRGSGGAEGEGARQWLVPRSWAVLPERAARLLDGISATYTVNTGVGTSPDVDSEAGEAEEAYDDRSDGAELCCALGAVEVSIAESDWSAAVCGTDLLRLDRGRLPGSTDDKTVRWMRTLRWAMALVAQAVRLCAWRTPSPTSALMLQRTNVSRTWFDRPWDLALSLGSMARKLWHLHLDVCLGPTGDLQATTDDVCKDGPVHFGVYGALPSARLPCIALGSSTVAFNPAAASSAAILAQHCLRWLLDQPLLHREELDPSQVARKAAQAKAALAGVAAGEVAATGEPPFGDRADEVKSVDALCHVPLTVQLASRAREELAMCLRTEAGVLARIETLVGDTTASLRQVLRSDAHTSCANAWHEITSLLASSELRLLVGHDLLVHWPLDRRWYRCRVLNYEPSRAEHLVKYELDAVEEWLDLDAEEWRFCTQAQASSSAQVCEMKEACGATVPAPVVLSPMCVLSSVRSSLARRVHGEALMHTRAAARFYMRELSLSARLVVAERATTPRAHAHALHMLAAAQAHLIVQHRGASSGRDDGHGTLREGEGQAFEVGNGYEHTEEHAESTAEVMRILAKFGTAATLEMMKAATSSRAGAAAAAAAEGTLRRGADVAEEEAGDEEGLEEAIADEDTFGQVDGDRDGAEGDTFGESATEAEVDGAALAETATEALETTGHQEKDALVREINPGQTTAASAAAANIAAAQAVATAAAAAAIASIVEGTRSADGRDTGVAAAKPDPADAPEGKRAPSWEALLSDTEEALRRCLQYDRFHHRSRLLLAQLAWAHGSRISVVRSQCEQLLCKSGTIRKKPAFIWLLWQYSSPTATDDRREGTSLRAYELFDDAVALGRLYAAALLVDGSPFPSKVLNNTDTLLADPARPLLLLRAFADFAAGEGMSALRDYAIMRYLECVMQHVDAHTGTLDSDDIVSPNPVASTGAAPADAADAQQLQVSGPAGQSSTSALADTTVAPSGGDVPSSIASGASSGAASNAIGGTGSFDSRDVMSSAEPTVQRQQLLPSTHWTPKQQAEMLHRRRELLRCVHEVQQEPDYASLLPRVAPKRTADSLLSDAFRAYRALQQTLDDQQRQAAAMQMAMRMAQQELAHRQQLAHHQQQQHQLIAQMQPSHMQHLHATLTSGIPSQSMPRAMAQVMPSSMAQKLPQAASQLPQATLQALPSATGASQQVLQQHSAITQAMASMQHTADVLQSATTSHRLPPSGTAPPTSAPAASAPPASVPFGNPCVTTAEHAPASAIASATVPAAAPVASAAAAPATALGVATAPAPAITPKTKPDAQSSDTCKLPHQLLAERILAQASQPGCVDVPPVAANSTLPTPAQGVSSAASVASSAAPAASSGAPTASPAATAASSAAQATSSAAPSTLAPLGAALPHPVLLPGMHAPFFNCLPNALSYPFHPPSYMPPSPSCSVMCAPPSQSCSLPMGVAMPHVPIYGNSSAQPSCPQMMQAAQAPHLPPPSFPLPQLPVPQAPLPPPPAAHNATHPPLPADGAAASEIAAFCTAQFGTDTKRKAQALAKQPAKQPKLPAKSRSAPPSSSAVIPSSGDGSRASESPLAAPPPLARAPSAAAQNVGHNPKAQQIGAAAAQHSAATAVAPTRPSTVARPPLMRGPSAPPAIAPPLASPPATASVHEYPEQLIEELD